MKRNVLFSLLLLICSFSALHGQKKQKAPEYQPVSDIKGADLFPLIQLSLAEIRTAYTPIISQEKFTLDQIDTKGLTCQTTPIHYLGMMVHRKAIATYRYSDGKLHIELTDLEMQNQSKGGVWEPFSSKMKPEKKLLAALANQIRNLNQSPEKLEKARSLYQPDGSPKTKTEKPLEVTSSSPEVFTQSPIEIAFSDFVDQGNLPFGAAIANVGDLDQDGGVDFVVGTPGRKGKLWVAFLGPGGKAKKIKEIPNFTGWYDEATMSITSLGDLSGDGYPEIAVNAIGSLADMDAGTYYPIHILSLNADGTVKSRTRIANYAHNGKPKTANYRNRTQDLMVDLRTLGDLDGDGVVDLIAGAPRHEGNGKREGAAFILFLNADGSLKSSQEISTDNGSFEGLLDKSVRFGYAVAPIGDVNGDGNLDIAISAVLDDDAGTKSGAVWLLFLEKTGTVKGFSKLSNARGGLQGKLDNTRNWGCKLISMGDLNEDGIQELGVLGYDNTSKGVQETFRVLYLNAKGEATKVVSLNLNTSSTYKPDQYAWQGIGLDHITDKSGKQILGLAIGNPHLQLMMLHFF